MLFPMASIYAHLSYFFSPWHLLLAGFCVCAYLLTGNELSLSDGYWAKQTSIPSQKSNFPARTSVQTPRLCLSLGIKHLGNASALKNCLNPSRPAVLGKGHQYSNKKGRKGKEPDTLLFC